MDDDPRISLVIPAYNEQKLLPAMLASVRRARHRWHGDPTDIEVIVADNRSTDRTVEIASDHGARVVHVEKRVIGAVRNGGADVARGEILCFADADYQIHPETFNRIAHAMESGRYVAGASGVTLDKMSIGLALTYAWMVPLAWMLRLDTGVVFCRRADFEAIGGYDEARLFAEDVAFLFALKARGKRRGQRLSRLGCKALVSTRKFDQFGQWHYFIALVWWVAARLGLSSERAIADKYWYKTGR